MKPVDLVRYEWLLAQHKWHDQRAVLAGSLMRRSWHVTQRAWYRRQLRRMLPAALSAMLTLTFEKHQGALMANMTRSNVLLDKLKGLK